jgi:SAM-dependent methyltransferase
MPHKIGKIDVHLVSAPVLGGFADATRKVETIGFLIVRITTDQGLEGISITCHEVGGEATRELINRNMAPKLINRDPLESDAIWQEFFHYLRGVGRKGLMYCALSAIDIALWDLKGKIVDLPIYKLPGGDRKKVPVYASGGWTSYSDDQLVDEVEGMVARGSVGADLSPGMMELAQHLYPTIEYREADVEQLPFPDHTFDAVVCAFGLGHFPRPELAVAECVRTLSPGRRIAFSWWDDPSRQRIQGIFRDAIAEIGVSAPLDVPQGHNVFRFSNPGEFLRLLDGARLTDVKITEHAASYFVPDTETLGKAEWAVSF